MSSLVAKYSRLTLTLVTTFISILASLLIVHALSWLLQREVTTFELTFATVAPLIIASLISWYLFGVLKRLELLEHELRQSISKEKESIYVASILGAQHVINNLLNELQLVELEIDNHPQFDKKITSIFHDTLQEANELMQRLSSVKEINAEEITRSVSPQVN
jgi:hypothetical protein